MQNSHDPYLNTVRRNLTEERIKKRQTNIKNTSKEPKNFLSKNIVLTDYISLPEGFQNLFLISLFIMIPYLFGILILLLILSSEVFAEYSIFDFQSFMLTWTIGYEGIALLLILLIIKSAITFKAPIN